MAGSFLTKAIGLAALGIAAHDTISTSSHMAPKYKRMYRLSQLNDVYMNSASSASCSKWDAQTQKWSRRWALDNNLRDIDQNIRSKLVAFGKSFTDNVFLWGLGLTALFTGKGKLSVLKIPYLDKIAAATLALSAGKNLVVNALGWGGKDYRSNSFDY